jgi:hypothetical protein
MVKEIIIPKENKTQIEEVREVEIEVPGVEKTKEAKTEGQSSSSTASTDDEKIAKAIGGTITAAGGVVCPQAGAIMSGVGAVASKAMESIGNDTGNPK